MMRAVQARTGECVAVSAQNGHRMQFISVLPTPGVVLNEIHAGLKFALVGSASGAAILATKTDTEIISIVRKVMAGRSSRERSDTVELTLEHARLARKNRFAVSFLDPLPFAMSIAIMLRDPVAGVPWALCIGGSKSDLQGREHEMATAMRQTVANFVFAGGAG
jgi:DNA-binding IclR family transcriptional regulator